MNNLSERNINIDIIKCLAVFFVISVHFFLNNNFYNTDINCTRMYIMGAMRKFFMICVPLFLLTTGFLMHKKEFSAKYYKSICNIIIPYIIISVFTLIAKIFLSKYGIFTLDTWNNYIIDFVNFHLVEYGWYVDMYIGLFLLIPFINKMFVNKQKDLILVSILVFLTVLPSISNSPALIISQWTCLWPITYYVIGAYIAKYDINIPIKKSLLCLYTLICYFQ